MRLMRNLLEKIQNNRPNIQKESYEQRFYKGMKKTREKTREKIIRLITENPQITTEELAKKTEISFKGMEWQIKRLKKDHIIKRIGPDKGGYWKVNQEMIW